MGVCFPEMISHPTRHVQMTPQRDRIQSNRITGMVFEHDRLEQHILMSFQMYSATQRKTLATKVSRETHIFSSSGKGSGSVYWVVRQVIGKDFVCLLLELAS